MKIDAPKGLHPKCDERLSKSLPGPLSRAANSMANDLDELGAEDATAEFGFMEDDEKKGGGIEALICVKVRRIH